jgi:hypothetical protein
MDDVNLIVGQDLVERSIGLGQTQFQCGTPRTGRARSQDAADVNPQSTQRLQVNPAHKSGADDRYSQTIHFDIPC